MAKTRRTCTSKRKTKEQKKQNQTAVKKNQKDTIFRMLFRDKKNLLSLYNALNQTNYTDSEELEIVTLENAVYMNMKNDLAFLMEDYLNLYEHQSTYNPNMPLRDLFYIAKELEGLVDQKRLYGSSLIKIPTPRFFVFYNGTGKQAEKQILHLSDAFECPTNSPELELTVTMLNINSGNNLELLDACKVLGEYTQYVTKVRNYAKKSSLVDAVEQAVEECIQENILREFLLKNKKEAMAVSIFEYDEEATLQYIREDEFAQGKKQGKAEGRAEAILDLLEGKGSVSEELYNFVMNQHNLTILQSWLKLAANAESVEEFQREIFK